MAQGGQVATWIFTSVHGEITGRPNEIEMKSLLRYIGLGSRKLQPSQEIQRQRDAIWEQLEGEIPARNGTACKSKQLPVPL